MAQSCINTKKGLWGETLCAKYLVRNGYKILKRNWYCHWGEIDLITCCDAVLVFVEVKTVFYGEFCKPVELFTTNKRRHLLKTISHFLSANKGKINKWRLDLVCITKDNNKAWIEHYKNVLAF